MAKRTYQTIRNLYDNALIDGDTFDDMVNELDLMNRDGIEIDDDDTEAIIEIEGVSLQEASYRLWLAENEMEGGYGTIGDMAWDEPEAARLLREEQRIRLQAMSPEQYNEWLDQQTEEYISRFDATDGRGC